MKDYKEILLKYKFTDEIGHPIENCQDYLDLLDDLHEAVKVEREACAKIAELTANHTYEAHVGRVSKSIATEIRARSEKAV